MNIKGTNAKNAVKVTGAISKCTGYASALYSGGMFITTPNLRNGIDFTMGGVSLIYWEVGIVYEIGKIHWEYYNMDLDQRRENLKNGIDPSQGTLNPMTHRIEYPIFQIDYNKVLNLK